MQKTYMILKSLDKNFIRETFQSFSQHSSNYNDVIDYNSIDKMVKINILEDFSVWQNLNTKELFICEPIDSNTVLEYDNPISSYKINIVKMSDYRKEMEKFNKNISHIEKIKFVQSGLSGETFLIKVNKYFKIICDGKLHSIKHDDISFEFLEDVCLK